MIPEIILGMVLMAFFYMLNLPFGMLTLLIGHTVFCIPYILMEVKARLVGMDPSLEEAARDLGATSLRAFFDITLPLIMPAVASGSLRYKRIIKVVRIIMITARAAAKGQLFPLVI